MTLQEAIIELNEYGIYFADKSMEFKVIPIGQAVNVEEGLKLFQLADWLEELSKLKKQKFKGRCEHGNMHYECKYCKEELT